MKDSFKICFKSSFYIQATFYIALFASLKLSWLGGGIIEEDLKGNQIINFWTVDFKLIRLCIFCVKNYFEKVISVFIGSLQCIKEEKHNLQKEQ